LLASLNSHVQSSCKKELKNLGVVLLMTCLKTFCEIFDTWWTEARLDDLKQEFLMQKIDEGEFEVIQPRLLEKSKEKSFYLNDDVSRKITNDEIIETMLNYSNKAGFTLNIISKLDRINEMRQMVNDSESLHDEFVRRIEREVAKFAQTALKKQEKPEDLKEEKNRKLVEDIRNGLLADGDDLMLLVFQSTFDKLTADPPKATEESPLALYDILNQASDFILLPIEHSIHQIINELLQSKIAIAESFVMNIYFHEFHVEQNLQDMRKIFFVESAELINFFCFKLFPSIESGESTWANPYLLTVALNDALSSTRQPNSAMFSVSVKKKLNYHSVLEAMNEITLNFKVNQNLCEVFPAAVMEKYNEGELVDSMELPEVSVFLSPSLPVPSEDQVRPANPQHPPLPELLQASLALRQTPADGSRDQTTRADSIRDAAHNQLAPQFLDGDAEEFESPARLESRQVSEHLPADCMSRVFRRSFPREVAPWT
jgi:chorismate mutase